MTVEDNQFIEFGPGDTVPESCCRPLSGDLIESVRFAQRERRRVRERIVRRGECV